MAINYIKIYEYLEENQDEAVNIFNQLDNITDFLGDDKVVEMEYITEYYRNDLENFMFRMFYGYRYNPYDENTGRLEREQFNPNDEYFSYNGYGNLVSISKYDLFSWLYRCVDDYTINSLIENIDDIDVDDDFLELLEETENE